MPWQIEALGVTYHKRVEDALEGADVIDVLRIQLERQDSGLFPSMREYAREFGLNEARYKLANPGAVVLHPGPMNRGTEISFQWVTPNSPSSATKYRMASPSVWHWNF